ncbi:hypothetical protein DFJ77DRAFT_189181 [Powellomyces hirtus]|nr:hypothetical protein DFJ77DRAFT_189181 [Powellomyces hirtus]
MWTKIGRRYLEYFRGSGTIILQLSIILQLCSCCSLGCKLAVAYRAMQQAVTYNRADMVDFLVNSGVDRNIALEGLLEMGLICDIPLLKGLHEGGIDVLRNHHLFARAVHFGERMADLVLFLRGRYESLPQHMNFQVRELFAHGVESPIPVFRRGG